MTPADDIAGPQTARVGPPRYGGSSELLVPGRPDIPFVLEGELVRIAEPAPPEILEASPDRVPPPCRHFGTCGGCQYQHMADAAQLRTKTSILTALLARAGVPTPPPTVDAGPPWHYRNRVRFRIEGGRIGYTRRATHTFLPISECPILAPLLWRAAQAAEAIATWPAASTELEFATTADESALQLSLHLDADVLTLDREAPAVFRALCVALQQHIPQLTGAGLLVRAAPDPKAPRRVQDRARVEVARWGQPGLAYDVAGRQYPVTRGAFFQVNRFLTARLVERVLGDHNGTLALDLYAGAGLFSVPLAERFTRVVSVEIGEPAATDLTRRVAPQRAARQTTLDFLRTWNRGRELADLVVLDPPRAGVGPAAMAELIRLRAPTLVYVSCDPVSFSREARTLVDSGYAVAELHLLDLFPQTFHMETVAVFRRS